MEFRLTYDGLLPNAGKKNNRKREKHDIRMQLHPQFCELWFTHPGLRHLQVRRLRFFGQWDKLKADRSKEA
jgi:hypothetical protein